MTARIRRSTSETGTFRLTSSGRRRLRLLGTAVVAAGAASGVAASAAPTREEPEAREAARRSYGEAAVFLFQLRAGASNAPARVPSPLCEEPRSSKEYVELVEVDPLVFGGVVGEHPYSASGSRGAIRRGQAWIQDVSRGGDQLPRR